MFKLIYIPWLIGILIAAVFLFRAIKRIIKGIINYRRLGKEEFMRRLKKGFDGITPTQRVKAELRGIIITIIGLVAGLIAFPIIRITGIWWWAEIILVGSLILTLSQLTGKLQQYRVFKKQDDLMKELGIK